jgi:hypothetical protein
MKPPQVFANSLSDTAGAEGLAGSGCWRRNLSARNLALARSFSVAVGDSARASREAMRRRASSAVKATGYFYKSPKVTVQVLV